MTSHVYCSSSYSEPIVDKVVGDLKWIKVSKTLTKKVKIIMNKSSAELERMLGGDGENFMVASKKTTTTTTKKEEEELIMMNNNIMK